MAKKRRRKVVTKPYKHYTSLSPDELAGVSYNELRSALTKLNKEANRRLETASRRKNKGQYVPPISEYKVRATRTQSHRMTKTPEGQYGYIPFTQKSRMTKVDVIKDIVERSQFLNKKTSTPTGVLQSNDIRNQTIRNYFKSEGYSDSEVTDAMVRKFGKLMKRMEDDNMISSTFGSNMNIYDSDQVIREAVAYAMQNKRRGINQLYNHMKDWEKEQKAEQERKSAMRRAALTDISSLMEEQGLNVIQ